jgi:hypothetical protein
MYIAAISGVLANSFLAVDANGPNFNTVVGSFYPWIQGQLTEISEKKKLRSLNH